MDLLQNAAYINGNWVGALSQNTFPVTNPATGDILGSVPDMDEKDTRFAIEAANQAWQSWRKQSADYRAKLLKKWHALILENADALASLLSLEQGKPLREAKGEILYGASFVEWFAEEARRVYGDVMPAPNQKQRILVLKQPIGVVAAITPWNFPNAMITRKVAPALAAGCTVVIKPAEDTPFSALALALLAEKAGFPPGVLNVVTTAHPAAVGLELCENPQVRKISFTGSTEVGKILLRQSASTVKKVSLELGGNAPFIVFEDANIEAAVEGAMVAKFRNAGQTCICANRIFVHEKIQTEFVEKLGEAIKKLKLGAGNTAGAEVGPLINAEARHKILDLLEDAKNNGATVELGGKIDDLGGNFFQPTLLTGVISDMRLAKEEIFGPIAAILSFSTEEEVISMANDTEFGLAAYFFSNDLSKVWRVAEALEYGMVGINTGHISTASAPFGGIKQSGLGREGSKYGMDDFLEIKYLGMGI